MTNQTVLTVELLRKKVAKKDDSIRNQFELILIN